MEKDTLELFWQHDPNGLVIVNSDLEIIEANPAFLKMFQLSDPKGFEMEKLLSKRGIEAFKKVFETKKSLTIDELILEPYGLIAKVVLFPIPEKDVAAGIFVDITKEYRRRRELAKIKVSTVEKINRVISKQMEIAQEIASLLGETTAETKASLLKLLQVIEKG